MAEYYVDSAAAGAGTGGNWTDAYTKLATAMTGKAAGDTFWVAHTHNEPNTAAINMISPGTSVAPCRILCVDKAGTNSAADLRTTAIINMTGGAFTLAFTGIAYCYGIEFKAGDAATISVIRWSTSGYWKHKNCKFTLNTTGTTSAINPASSALARTDWEDCTVRFGHVSQNISPSGGFLWVATATTPVLAIDTTAGGVTPAPLFGTNASGATRIRGLDLTAYSSTGLIAGGIAQSFSMHMENCKHGTTTMGPKVNTIANIMMQDYVFSRVDKAVNYTFDKHSYAGTETAEITVVRTGGASDGTTPIAKKITTLTNSKIDFPFECIPITVWNETVGSAITLTVQAIWSVGAAGNYPTNAQIWIEVEYLSNASYPITAVSSGGLATVLSTPVAYSTAGTGTWGSLGGTPTSFAMARTFTPQMKGPITVRIKAALPGGTTVFYVDPKVIIT